MTLTEAVVLHGTLGPTFGEYLVRVLVSLLTFVAITVVAFGCVRTIDFVRSMIEQVW